MTWLHALLLAIPCGDGPLLRIGARELWAFDGGVLMTRDRVVRWEWRKPGYVPLIFKGVLLRFAAPYEGEKSK